MTEKQNVIAKRRRTVGEIQQIVSDFKSSGLNGNQFCQEQGLSRGALYRYVKRLARGNDRGPGENALVAVELAGGALSAEPVGSGRLAVVLAKGRRITVSAGFDTATLQRLVHVLEAM